MPSVHLEQREGALGKVDAGALSWASVKLSPGVNSRLRVGGQWNSDCRGREGPLKMLGQQGQEKDRPLAIGQGLRGWFPHPEGGWGMRIHERQGHDSWASTRPLKLGERGSDVLAGRPG